MEVIIFSGQRNFTREMEDIIRERRLEKRCVIVEAFGAEMKQAAQSYLDKGAKIFIARGRNWDILKESFDIPIIEVRCTYEEILLAYTKARVFPGRMAILGFGSIFTMIKKFKELSGNDFLPIEFKDLAMVDGLVREAKEAGYQLFVGGLSTREACEKYGLKHVMLEIDRDSLEIAIDEALHLLSVQSERQKNYQLIQTLLDSATEAVIGFDQRKNISYINAKARTLFKNKDLETAAAELFPPETVKSVMEEGSRINNQLISMDGEKMILSIIPLRNRKETYGAVAYLNTATDVISTESSLRAQLYAKGHVAKNRFSDIIGKSSAVTQTIDWGKRIALSENAVLITGESGTGKELFAQSIHNFSNRQEGPFIAINCASLSSSVLESELFGYVKGAFTGASAKGKMGIFEMAHHGTVFLDEIGEISMEVQAKLLRVLQEKEILRVGGEKVIPVDVRIISATNKDLDQLTQEKKFRNDLFYRLAVLELNLPPLRERNEDIPLIARHYLKQHYPNLAFEPRSLDKLRAFSYPGNIRHLINIIERCVVMSDGASIQYQTACAVIDRERSHVKGTEERRVLADPEPMATGGENEKERIRRLLEKNFGSRKKTARALGISTTTLWRKLKRYGLMGEDGD